MTSGAHISPVQLAVTRYGEGDRLAPMRKVLEALGQPDRSFEIIHVSGTNGKGSTSTMIGALLEAKGQKVGYFTSPYFDHPREMIQINGTWLSLSDFEAYENRLLRVVESTLGDAGSLSEFELSVCIALLYFKEQGVTTAVLECGLGGSLDATNAVENVTYSIFTPISLDHLGLLGSTVEEIARNKAGMIRQGDRVITASPQLPEVLDVLAEVCQDRQASLLTGEGLTLHAEADRAKMLYHIHLAYPDGSSYRFDDALLGHYQLQNLRTVATWVKDYSQRKGWTLSNDWFNQALSHLSIRGRFERMAAPVETFLDGGHNVAGIKALMASLREWEQGRPIIGVSAFLKDKQVKEALSGLDQLAAVVVTTAAHPERALPAEKLAKIYQSTCQDLPVYIVQEPTAAYHEAVQLAKTWAREGEDPLIVVFGSFYLLKVIRPLLSDPTQAKASSTRLI